MAVEGSFRSRFGSTAFGVSPPRSHAVHSSRGTGGLLSGSRSFRGRWNWTTDPPGRNSTRWTHPKPSARVASRLPAITSQATTDVLFAEMAVTRRFPSGETTSAVIHGLAPRGPRSGMQLNDDRSLG